MQGKLRLEKLEVVCIIGDLPEERTSEQKLVVDAELLLDFSCVVSRDDVSATVDYAKLVSEIREGLREAKCRTIEKAAYVVCQICLLYTAVKETRVSVRKSGRLEGLGAAVAELVVSRQD